MKNVLAVCVLRPVAETQKLWNGSVAVKFSIKLNWGEFTPPPHKNTSTREILGCFTFSVLVFL